jgi:Tol biopolymer transport system component
MAVVWVDRTGQVTGRAVPDLVDNPRDPRLSPDGQRLLLVTGPENDGDLWSYDLRGRPPIPLALPSDNRFPAWSADGRQVAFLSLGGGGVMTLLADGSERASRQLLPGLWGPHVWSATGDVILTRPSNDIFMATAEPSTDEARPLVATESGESDPALSTDGRWLAYVSNRTGRDEIWVQGYPDGAPVRVSSGGGYEPQWSADGRELFYRQGNAVMAVTVEPGAEFSFGAPQTLFSGAFVQHSNPAGRGWAVAPDGRFLMLVPSDENVPPPAGNIVVVQNFAEEIKRRARPSEP